MAPQSNCILYIIRINPKRASSKCQLFKVQLLGRAEWIECLSQAIALRLGEARIPFKI